MYTLGIDLSQNDWPEDTAIYLKRADRLLRAMPPLMQSTEEWRYWVAEIAHMLAELQEELE